MTRRILIQFVDAGARKRARGLIPTRVDAVDNGGRGIDIEVDDLMDVVKALDEDGFRFRVEVIS